MAQKNIKSLKGIKENEVLSQYTTFRIGGPADLYIRVKSEAEIIAALKYARDLKIPYFLLGGGSNLLISDQGFRGLIIKNEHSRFKIYREDAKYKINAGSGLKLADLIKALAERGLSGIEFLAGIPGTVGGAVRGNSGAWQQEIGKVIEKVKVLDSQGKTAWIKNADCRFSYRNSRFKNNDEIILEVKLILTKGDKKQIFKKITEYQNARSSQPNKPSAGCVFVNPKSEPAGKLIDQCGLKGRQIGDAQISPQHANFIVNLGKAKANQVIGLINLAKKEVKQKFGTELEEEICLLGFDRID